MNNAAAPTKPTSWFGGGGLLLLNISIFIEYFDPLTIQQCLFRLDFRYWFPSLARPLWLILVWFALDTMTLRQHRADAGNIDWGQDLFYLERWCKEHPEVKEIRTALWGSYPLEAASIPSAGMPSASDPPPGWYALSVNYLYDETERYRYFLHIEPAARAGYSIYIYYVTQDEAERV